MTENNNIHGEQTYYVKGMHCASCELVIEKKLLEFSNIKSADAIVKKGILKVSFIRGKPEALELNEVFHKNNYQL
jgi:copper chaperone CopZ